MGMGAKPTVKLWSVAQGKLVDFAASIENDEIVCVNGDEAIKFPGGISPEELKALVQAHNDANSGVKGITEDDIKAQAELKAANERLLDSLR